MILESIRAWPAMNMGRRPPPLSLEYLKVVVKELLRKPLHGIQHRYGINRAAFRNSATGSQMADIRREEQEIGSRKSATE